MALPVNVDETYPDVAGKPSVKTHQQHHDVVHAAVNRVPDDGSPVMTESAANAAYPRVGALDGVTGPITVGTVMGRLPSSGRAHDAFPSVLTLPGGRVLCAFRGGTLHDSADGDIYLTSSADYGRTWSAPAVAVDVASNVQDPSLSRLSDGTLLMTMFGNASGVLRAYLSRSTNDGVMWSAPALVPFTWTGWAAISAPAVQLANGTVLVAAYGRDSAEARTSARTMRSIDGGLTWIDERTVANGTGDAVDYQEPNLLLLADGSLRALIRTEFTTPYVIKTSTSTDGLVWSAPAVAFAGRGNPHALLAGDGTILVAYRDTVTKFATLRASTDQGVTWSEQSEFGAVTNQMTYASMVETSPGLVLCVWGREESNAVGWLHSVYFSQVSGLTPFGDPIASGSAPSVVDYVAQADVAQRFVPSSAFLLANGVPAVTAFGSGHAAWMLDPATTEAVTTFIDFIPPWWVTFHVDLWWAPRTVDAGNVQFDVSSGFFGSGIVVNSGAYVGGAANLAAAPGVADRVAVHRVITDSVNTPTKVFQLRVLRAGAAAGDTYPGDVAFLGAWLRRAS